VGAGRLPVRVDRHHPMRPGHRVWSLVPGALAASLVIVTLLSSLQRPPAPTGDDVGPTIQVAGFPGAAAAFAAPRPAPALVDRHADTDLIGIRGADGNIYFIEIDRIRTLSRPSRGSGVRLAGYDM